MTPLAMQVGNGILVPILTVVAAETYAAHHKIPRRLRAAFLLPIVSVVLLPGALPQRVVARRPTNSQTGQPSSLERNANCR